MKQESIVVDKTHKFVLTIETTKLNPRAFIGQLIEELGEDVYFEVKDVKVI